MKHEFTAIIVRILNERFGDKGEDLLDASPLLQYLNFKTRSANRGAKARGSFANHYALYVLVEDYIKKGYLQKPGAYDQYEGARFSDLFARQRELPFGAKLQNHALNSRLNDEFAKYFPTIDAKPILRDLQEQRYWVNESLLEVKIGTRQSQSTHNIAEAVIDIVDAYVAAKRAAFESFIETCRALADMSIDSSDEVVPFVVAQLQPNVDARVFEIVSFSILKAHYREKSIFWGWSANELQEEFLVLYKTGRTNANDGGIDFVMKPLGRFFQVTETIDVNKYFLDIDKIQRFPLTFVVKTCEPPDRIYDELRAQASRKYRIEAIVQRYIQCVEEVINIPSLTEIFRGLSCRGLQRDVMNEIVLQSRVEFNYDDPEGDSGDSD
jgi:hypothetical protein